MELSRLKLMTSIIKLFYLGGLCTYPFLYTDTVYRQENIIRYVFLIFILISAFLLSDLFDNYRLVFLGVASAITTILYFNFDDFFMLAFIPLAFDLLITFKLRPRYALLILLPAKLAGEHIFWYEMMTLGFLAIYHLINVSLKDRVISLIEFDKNERNLKNMLSDKNKKHSQELTQIGLKYETKHLEDMRDLSQQLHDKVGHSLSGSIFKLEAAKLLIQKQPEKSNEMLEEVIELLRKSSDEIRLLLRKQKPADSELGINKLKMILIEFKKNYAINTSFTMEGELDKLTSKHWSVIIENTLEALTNSLKYSNGDNINAELYIFNKVARYKICDNGSNPTFQHKGMGISGMEQRIYSLGGSLTVSTNQGFEINMIIPLEDKD